MIFEYGVAIAAIYFMVLHPLLSALCLGKEKAAKSAEYNVMLSLCIAVLWVVAWFTQSVEKTRLMDYIESDFKLGLNFGDLFTGGGSIGAFYIIYPIMLTLMAVCCFFIVMKNERNPLAWIVQPMLAVVVIFTFVTPSPNARSAYYQLDVNLSENMVQSLKAACPETQAISYVSKFKSYSDFSYIDNELYCNSGVNLDSFEDDYLVFNAFTTSELGKYHPSTIPWDLVIGFKGDAYVALIRFDRKDVPPSGSIDGFSEAAQKVIDTMNAEFAHKYPQLFNRLSLEKEGVSDDWDAIRVM